MLHERPSLRMRWMWAVPMLSLAAVVDPAVAANWEFDPRVATGYRYSDNYRLGLPGTEIDVSGAEIDAELTMGTVHPRTRFELTPRIRATYFPDEREEDSTDYYLTALLADDTPRRRTGVRADFSREDVVRSELPDPGVDLGLGEPDVGDAGRTLRRNRRDLIRLAPYWSYDVSQRHLVELEARYIDATFDSNFEGEQVDFSELVGTAGFGFAVTPRSTVMLRALASHYETNRTADGYGGEVEWASDITETSRAYLRVGAQRTEPERADARTSVIAGAGGRWQSQRNRLYLDLMRSVNPVSAGEVVERYELRARLEHDVSERVAWLVGLRGFRDEALDDTSTYPRREYVSGEAGFEVRLQRAWSVRAMYNYLWQEYADEPADASANGVMLSLIYEPRRPE